MSQRNAPSRYRGVAPCGTTGAASRHRYYGEPLCDACREAENDRRRRQKAGLVKPRRSPRHGTISGYRHLHPDGDKCGPCRDAMNEYNREWRRGRLRLPARRRSTPVRVTIVDVLETCGYPMTVWNVYDRIAEFRPDVTEKAVKRALARLVQAGDVSVTERHDGFFYQVREAA